MKKSFLILVSSIVLLMAFVGCSNTRATGSTVMLPNPISEISLGNMAKETGLKTIGISGIVNSLKISTSDPTYSLDVELDGRKYNVRISRSGSAEEADISGVYLADTRNIAVYDSSDPNAVPSMTVESDSNYSKAYGFWNGFCFSVSTDSAIPCENMAEVSRLFICSLIAKDNIL